MVSKLLTFTTGLLNPWIIESTHGINQARWPEFYKYTRLPVTRWVTNTINDEFDGNAILTDGNAKCYSDCIYVAIPYQGFVRKARIFQFTICGRQLFIKKRSV